MDWTQAFAIMATTGTFVFWAVSKLDGDIKALSAKVDADLKAQTQRIDQLSQRIDQLYGMFIDLLKNRKQ